MRVHHILILFLFMNSCTASDKTNTDTCKDILSPYTKSLIDRLEKSNEPETPSKELIEQYNLKLMENTYICGGILKVSQEIDEDELEKTGVRINSKINDIWSVRIPVDKLTELCNLSGVIYVEIDKPVKAVRK